MKQHSCLKQDFQPDVRQIQLRKGVQPRSRLLLGPTLTALSLASAVPLVAHLASLANGLIGQHLDGLAATAAGAGATFMRGEGRALQKLDCHVDDGDLREEREREAEEEGR